MKFNIFIPNQSGFKITPNKVFLGLLLLALAVLFIIATLQLPLSGKDIALVFKFIFGAILLIILARYIIPPPYYGHLAGTISFENTGLVINDESISYKDLDNLEFSISDFKGKINLGLVEDLFYTKSFNSVISRGVNNYFAFNGSGGKRQIVFFQIKNRNQLNDIKGFLASLIDLKRVPSKEKEYIEKKNKS